jgi:hypothetical protein
MTSGNLIHIIYTSTATSEFALTDMEPMLQSARSSNAARAVTGMLLYSTGSFFQVLEGEEATVTEMFAKIAADRRHAAVTKIIQEPIAHRAFGDWSMGYSQIDVAELESIEGFRDFFRDGNSLANLASGRANKLLTAFAKGRWRARLKKGGN